MTSVPTYTVRNHDQGTVIDQYSNQVSAIANAKDLLSRAPAGEECTFTVMNEDGYLIASITNRRIMGIFKKQEWSGAKKDHAMTVAEQGFDATSLILRLPRSELVKLEDDDESTDRIGTEVISWDGPYVVNLVDSILDFFGIEDLNEITDEALQYAREAFPPIKQVEEVIQVVLDIRVKRFENISFERVAQGLKYQVSPETPGVTVSSVEFQMAGLKNANR